MELYINISHIYKYEIIYKGMKYIWKYMKISENK